MEANAITVSLIRTGKKDKILKTELEKRNIDITNGINKIIFRQFSNRI